jgi:16S rRNA (guanine966-N2)-methyltransferase
MFSSLGGTCEGLRVLDLFAGAGSLGMEAWSRGAIAVTFVEQHSAVFKNLEKNIQSMAGEGLGAIKCVKGDAIRDLGRASGSFDLILADPPYDLPGAMEQTLMGIVEHSVLTDDGVLVYELRSSDVFEVSTDWKLLRDKVYGDTRVLMLKLT